MRIGSILAALLLAIAALGQRFRDEGPKSVFASKAEFHFIRMEYSDMPQVQRRFGFSSRSGRGEGWWRMDWPDAERHFTMGVQRLTRIDTGEPRHFRLTDDRLFDHPWIYATQVGWWDLSDAEAERLREYLLRGGFLMVDDFYGPEQWEAFRRTMDRVLPNRQIVEISESDSIMHVLYDIQAKDLQFIPGTRHLRRGPGGRVFVDQPPGAVPSWRAIYDDRDRMVVAINFNMDVADAWEYADWPEYPEALTSLAYRFGINYIVYSMTH
ncbi:MAG: DUF4159 domain-containing protein [Bryobacteraceae bacterium]